MREQICIVVKSKDSGIELKFQSLTLPLSCVSLGKLLNLSELVSSTIKWRLRPLRD